MPKIVIYLGLGLATLSLLSLAIAQNNNAPPTPAVESGPVELSAAPKAYQDLCVYCHEINVGPPLRGRGLAQDYVALIIRNGSRAMPAFRHAEIPDKELAEIKAYLAKIDPSLQRAENQSTMQPASAVRGKSIFEMACISCHGITGKADGVISQTLVPPVPAFTSSSSLQKTSQELLDVIENGKPGTAMPSWKSAISQQDIIDVHAYVLQLRQ